MKKALLTKLMLLLCALIAGSSSVWADSYTIGWGTASGNNSQNFTATSGSVTGVVSFSCVANSSTNPAYNSTNKDLRLYAQTSNGTGNGGSITLTPANGVTITGAVVTTTTEPTVNYYVNGGNGVAVERANNAYTVTGISATTSLTFKNVTTTNVQFRIKTIAITYTTSLSPSDLALTDAPINLNFDLYNNTTAQVIHYTTSSTGAVTVSDNDYITTSVDQNNKTITVTPKTTETPSTQTIIVSQAADNTYSAGSKTFTVTIDDSTPDPYNWVETSLANLTSSDIFAIVGTSSAGSFILPNNNGTAGAPTATTVTITNSKITSKVKDFLKWNLSGNATDGYTFYPNGDDATWLYCNTAEESGSNDNMRVGTGDRKVFEPEGNFLKTKDNKTARYLCVYSSQDWRGYISASPATNIKFYKRVDASQPIISANDVNISWDATNSTIAYAIENPANDGVLTATKTVDWITLGGVAANNIPFTTTANSTPVARTATVTLTYTYNTNQTVTKNVTITQAAGPYSTISDLFDAAATTAKTVLVTFNNWVVSGISTNGKNVFVTDGTNGFVINSSSDLSSTYAVGDILSGTGISCSLKKNYGYAQISDLASTPNIATGGTVSEANIDMDALAGVNTGALVSYDNLTCSVNNNKYYLSDGTTELQVYNTLFAFGTLKAGMKYNITGIYQQYNSTKEILPRSAADIVEVAAVITPAKTYTTLTAASALDFTGLANLEAYIVKDNDASDGYVTLTQVNKVPANTGLVLKATSIGSPIDVPVLTDAADDVTGNLMAGSATATTAIVANAGYILSDGAFHPASAGTLPAGKAYLNIPASAPVLLLNFGDDVTGIADVRSKMEDVRGNFFDLQGRKVAQPTKGLYIVNGKKYVVK